METNQILEAAINKFGKESQILKTIEELGELQIELARYLNNKGNILSITEEMADAYIMMHQLFLLFPKEQFDFFLNAKLNRLLDIVNNESVDTARSSVA